MQQSGQVAVVTKNRYGYGLKIEGNDNWFNSKYEIKCQKGDYVTFEDKGKGYVDGLTVTGGGSAPSGNSSGGGGNSGGHDKRQTSIVRQNAVTNANAFAIGAGVKMKSVDDLLDIARQIEVYTLGNEEVVLSDEDAEQEAALKALAEGNA